jgi:hypothetical protein
MSSADAVQRKLQGLAGMEKFDTRAVSTLKALAYAGKWEVQDGSVALEPALCSAGDILKLLQRKNKQ